jgi:hypothetical protein
VSVFRIRAIGGTRDCTVLFTGREGGGGSRTSKLNQTASWTRISVNMCMHALHPASSGCC